MSTKQQSQSQAEKMAPPNNSGEGDDDVAALIYRESQLRKAEAAAAAERKKASSSSTHHRTSTRKINVRNRDNTPMTTIVSHKYSNTKTAYSAEENDLAPKKVGRDGRYRKICTAEGCTNIVAKGVVCVMY